MNSICSNAHISLNLVLKQPDQKDCEFDFYSLKGPEKIKLADAPNNQATKDIIKMNQDFTYFTQALEAISKGKKPNYRESMLTKLLKQGFLPDTCTGMILTLLTNDNHTSKKNLERYLNTGKSAMKISEL